MISVVFLLVTTCIICLRVSAIKIKKVLIKIGLQILLFVVIVIIILIQLILISIRNINVISQLCCCISKEILDIFLLLIFIRILHSTIILSLVLTIVVISKEIHHFFNFVLMNRELKWFFLSSDKNGKHISKITIFLGFFIPK